jgi:predicted Fe-Mo cluster-binding NifX family protein
MRIAVASSDGVSISKHFGRSQCFIVFELVDGSIENRQVRPNTFTAHAAGQCSPDSHHEDKPHSHAQIVEALRDCEAVICYGMGWRAAEELSANGIQPLVVERQTTPEEAVRDFLSGRLKPASGFCCGRE